MHKWADAQYIRAFPMGGKWITLVLFAFGRFRDLENHIHMKHRTEGVVSPSAAGSRIMAKLPFLFYTRYISGS